MTEQQQPDSKEDDEEQKEQQQPPRKRSRNSSANSGMSYDSAIGDIYFAGTPHSALDLERELLELTSASCEAAAAALSGAVSPDDGRERQVTNFLAHLLILNLDLNLICTKFDYISFVHQAILVGRTKLFKLWLSFSPRFNKVEYYPTELVHS